MYYQYPDFFRILEEKVQRLEQENEELRGKIEQLKPIHIENINYKIQELTVRELKGTLNIGMTALSDPEEIKKWLTETDGEEVQLQDMEQEMKQDGMPDQNVMDKHQPHTPHST
ncbi:spore germination protein GerPC [Bacillus horti]|uniref:RNase H-like nuclease (RuvC/YqgF family) n=1 Tax=Caldalkalibacillus horti TaxID=77523 RepID=A0ABT9W1F3_9BACI|nr:spore germination protein GerPC [Bacillus horti]MDQ0166680.1 putative RNase H-like nuclease (RuvC/YqgF family) [Bacillus horti]